MSEAATPPPANGAPGSSTVSSHAKTMARNIIVSVASTVLGATAIYFLGFHNKGGHSGSTDHLVIKEATTKAWRSYVSIDNLYYKNILSLAKDPALLKDLGRYKSEMQKESTRFKKDVEDILQDKDIDKSFASMLNRRLDREKEGEEITTKLIDNLQSIYNSVGSVEEKRNRMIAENTSYSEQTKGLLERSVNEIEDLSKVLSEKFNQPFNLNDFLSYADYKKGVLGNNNANTNTTTTSLNEKTPDDPNNPGTNRDEKLIVNKKTASYFDPRNLAGDWTTQGADIYLGLDGKMEWEVFSTGDHAYGTWQFANDQIYMYANSSNTGQKTTWVFNLTNVTQNSFTMTLAVSPFNRYNLVRIQD